MKYLIFAALREDVNSGWVWVNIPKFEPRSIVCLHNPIAQKKIYCEVLKIDENFLEYYNRSGAGRLKIRVDTPTLVINEWYRKLLGELDTQSEYELQISGANNWIGMIFACKYHPQIIVRVAFWLGLISVVLGGAGILLGIISLY